MKKFIARSIVFLLLVACTVGMLSFLPKNKTDNDYLAGMIQKHERAKSINSPKIILAGGSNLAFGVESDRIEQEFAMPVVNLGLHAGLGTNLILDELKYVVEPNDIVLLIFEYNISSNGNILLQNLLVDLYPEATNFYKASHPIFIKLENTKNNLKNKLKILFGDKGLLYKQQRSLAKAEVYHKDAFNDHGDVVSHLDKSGMQGKFNVKYKMKYKYWEDIEAINDFYQVAQSKGVNVYYMFPNYPESFFNANKNVIARREKDLRNDLMVDVIGKPSDFVLPDTDFYDTYYHLNKDGRTKRTDKIIELIKANPRVLQSTTFPVNRKKKKKGRYYIELQNELQLSNTTIKKIKDLNENYVALLKKIPKAEKENRKLTNWSKQRELRQLLGEPMYQRKVVFDKSYNQR